MSWELERLGDVAQVVRGVTYQKPALLSQGHPDGIPLLRATNVQNRYVDYEEPVTVPRSLVKDNQFLQPGDILIASSSGSESVVGKSAKIVESTPATFGAFCTLLRATSIDPDFLAYFVSSGALRQRWRASARGSNINNLKASEIAQTEVPVPPLDEQKSIVAQLEDRLGKLEAVRARLKVIRDQLIQLRASALNENFGVSYAQFEWDRLPLSDVVIPIIGKRKTQRGWSPQCESHPASEGQWGVLKTTAVQMGWFEPTQNKALPSSLEPKPEVDIAVGDLLLLTTGPRNRCGIPALVDESPGKLMMSGKMARLRADSEKVLSEWLLLFLLSPQGQSELEQLKVGSSDSSVSIGAEVLLKIEVPVPTLEHQEKVVTDLAEVAATQRNVEAQLDDLEASLDSARSSILHRAFLAPEEAL